MNEFLKLECLQLACKVYESQLSVCKCTRYPLDLAKQFYEWVTQEEEKQQESKT